MLDFGETGRKTMPWPAVCDTSSILRPQVIVMRCPG